MGDVHRVSADVDGHEVYFESRDIQLLPSAEAWGSALLIPANQAGRPLVLEGAVDATWLENMRRLQEVIEPWWNHPPREVRASCVPPASPAAATGLCFSGGVDSFYSLLRREPRVDCLVSVVGYDMTVHDAPRVAAFERTLAAVAEAVGVASVLIRTNLREHPLVAATSWERAFGGALAAVGYFGASTLGRLVIPSSFPAHYSLPYGTHPRIDPLWSSSRLEVEEHGGAHWRFDKLRAVADEPLVQEHLRVCWENRAAHGNCSRCEKCLRTLLTLEAIGRRPAFACFDRTTPFGELVADYVPEGGVLAPAYEVELGRGLPPDVARAVRELGARTVSTRRMVEARAGKRPRRRLFGRRR